MNKSQRFASFWERLAAISVDIVIGYFLLFLGWIVILVLAGWIDEFVTIGNGAGYLGWSIPYIILLAYFTLLNYYKKATWGAMLVKLKIENKDGGSPRFVQVIVRDILFLVKTSSMLGIGFMLVEIDKGVWRPENLIFILPIYIFIVSILPMLLFKRNQTWADKLTGVYCVKK